VTELPDELPDTATVPATLRWAMYAIAAEALAFAGLAVFLVYQDIATTTTDLRAALVVTGFALLYAVTLGALARALWRRRGGARGLTIALQLMLAPVGYFLLTTGLPWIGLPAALLALAVIGLLLTPATTRALGLTNGAAKG
jgi:hypothetical protein